MLQIAPPPVPAISSGEPISAAGVTLGYAMHWLACPGLSDVRAAHISHSLEPQENMDSQVRNTPVRDGEVERCSQVTLLHALAHPQLIPVRLWVHLAF